MLEVLAGHLATYPPGSDGLIFTTDQGAPISRAHIGHIWRKAARHAAVDGFTFHDLRHLTASVLISRGASVKVVQRHLGHKSAKTTLDIYSHLWPDDEHRVRAALDEALGARVSQPLHGTSLPTS